MKKIQKIIKTQFNPLFLCFSYITYNVRRIRGKKIYGMYFYTNLFDSPKLYLVFNKHDQDFTNVD